MKSIHILYALILIIFFTSSCKKEDPFPITQQYVKGIVYDKYSTKPLANVKVYLCKARIPGTVRFECYDIIDEYITDSAGKYHFDFKQGNELIGVYAKIDDLYIDYGTVLDIGNYNRDSCNINFKPKSWQSFHIRNINPFSSSDLIEFEYKYFLYGSNIDTTIIIENYYDNVSPIIWSVTRNGSRNTFLEYFNCSPYDTIFYSIGY